MQHTYFNQHVLEAEPSLIRQMYQLIPTNQPTIDLGLGELSYPIPTKVRTTIERAMRESGTNQYTQNAGLPELRRSIAKGFNEAHGTAFSMENVLVTVGSTEALFLCYFLLSKSNSIVLLPEIGYTAYRSIAKLLGLRVVAYALNEDFSINVGDLVRKVKNTNGLKLIVINSPANPTGNVVTKETLDAIARSIQKRTDVFVLSDEIYSAFVYERRKHLSIASLLPDMTIVIDGLSKQASMTGYRIGWMIAPFEIINQMQKVHAFAVTAAPSIVQFGILPVVRGECRGRISFFRKDLEKKRNVMVDALSGGVLHVEKPDGAFYCFVNIAQYGSSYDVAKRILRETGVITVPGKAFGDAGDNFIRLSFAGDAQDVRNGIKKMKGAFDSWQN